MTMRERLKAEEKIEELRLQTFNLNYDRWKLIYDDSREKLFTLEGEEVKGTPINDPADLDAWFDRLGAQKNLSGQQVQQMFETRRKVSLTPS